jgi:hypothetical protein
MWHISEQQFKKYSEDLFDFMSPCPTTSVQNNVSLAHNESNNKNIIAPSICSWIF